MAFIHVFLFVYAIGGDVAVHYIGKYITRSELSLEERLRVRDLRFIVDMSARSALVLLLAVGFTLAQAYGSPVTGIWLALLWVADLAWLALVWLVYFNKGTPKGARLQSLDMGIRYFVIASMLAFGSYCPFKVKSGWRCRRKPRDAAPRRTPSTSNSRRSSRC